MRVFARTAAMTVAPGRSFPLGATVVDGGVNFCVYSGARNMPGEERRFGSLVSPGVYAHYHQHVFNMRLEVAIDGERCTS